MGAKRYVYKVYRSNSYVGTLPASTVVSDFGYDQDINTAGTEITIELAASLTDAGATITTTNITDESLANITDEDLNPIYATQTISYATIPIDLGNIIEVYLYYSGAVNGQVVFSGIITSWKANYTTNTIQLKVMSQGVKLQNYLVSIPANSTAESFIDTSSYTTLYATGSSSSNTTVLAQTFTVPSGINMSSIELLLYANSPTVVNTMTIRIITGVPDSGNAELGYATRLIDNASEEWQRFTFSQPVALAVSTTYSMLITLTAVSVDTNVSIAVNTAGGYANGAMYKYTSSWGAASGDAGFKIYTSTSSIGYNFTSTDPSTMLRSILDNFKANGGPITYNSTSIESTGTVSTYYFKFDRVLDGVKKTLELSPVDWYWYVDRGTNILYFKYKSNTPNHTFVVGRDIVDLQLENTLENVANVVYFSGGDTGGGVNLLTLNSNQTSLSSYGQWLETLSDNRVTTSSTAGIISQNTLDKRAFPSYRTTITIPAVTYDIETIELGHSVDFQNAGDFADTLLLQVVGISRTPDKVTLRLDSALPTVSHRIEDIARNLEAVYTIGNPADAS